MNKSIKKSIGWSIEGKILVVLLVMSVAVLVAAWGAAMKLRQTVADNAAVMNVDPGALIAVEQLRGLAESKITNSRAFFLLGSKSIFDKQKEDKQQLIDSLAKFVQKYDLPGVADIAKQIETLATQEQEIFDQGMEFREKQTESKIVAQFYNSKTSGMIGQYNDKFNEIVKLHNEDLAKSRERAREAGLSAQAQIPQGMTMLTAAVGALFIAFALLVMRVMHVRRFHLRERDRLVGEAKAAVLARDEVIAAASQDFKEPLTALNGIAESLKSTKTPDEVRENAELIQAVATEMQGAIDDIYDQKKADMGSLTLRLDQLKVSDILEDAQVMMQPLAKQRDVTLQFDSLNQSTLAYVDRERVLRVLANLVGNAIKFSRKHGRVSVKVKTDAQFVNIAVHDSGPGMPDTQLGTVFENFWQARKTADQGAGIGLAVVKTIIDAHGGSVTAANSNIGQGCVFTFTLPRRRPVGAQIKKPSSSGVRHMARPASSFENPDGPAL